MCILGPRMRMTRFRLYFLKGDADRLGAEKITKVQAHLSIA